MESDDSYELYNNKMRLFRRERIILNALNIFQLSIILNLIYDFSLLMSVYRPRPMELFYHQCKPQYFFSIFLDITLSILQFVLAVFLFTIIKNKNFSEIGISNIYYGGFLVFWLGFKLICLKLAKLHQKCLYIDFFELLLMDTLWNLLWCLPILIFVKFLLYLCFYWFYLVTISELKKKFKRFLEYNSG